MSRWPAPGRCKRRLAAGIGADTAARVQRRLTDHTLAVARQARQRLHDPPLRLVLAVEGLAPRAARRWGHRLGVDQVELQGAGGLALRLRRQLQRAWRQGASGVVLIGSDLPDLQVDDLLAAQAALASTPLVIGPAVDGGYWLIGLGRPLLGRQGLPLLCGRGSAIPWGTAGVLDHTLAAASAAGLAVQPLGQRRDLDRSADLVLWR